MIIDTEVSAHPIKYGRYSKPKLGECEQYAPLMANNPHDLFLTNSNLFSFTDSLLGDRASLAPQHRQENTIHSRPCLFRVAPKIQHDEYLKYCFGNRVTAILLEHRITSSNQCLGIASIAAIPFSTVQSLVGQEKERATY